jgi:hypothetical protein
MERAALLARQTPTRSARPPETPDDAFIAAAERLARLIVHKQRRRQAETDFAKSYVARQRAKALALGGN